jgi:hypothetical protein
LRSLPEDCRPIARFLLQGTVAARPAIFHGLNQRLPQRLRRTVTTFHDLFG